MGAVISLISIDSIVCDKSVWPREKADEKAIERYRRAMQKGDIFPKIIVTGIKGTVYLVDGYHRLNAMLRLGIKEAECEVISCRNVNDAYAESVKRNITHGVAFSEDDHIGIIKRLSNDGKTFDEISDILRMPSGECERIYVAHLERSQKTGISRRCGDLLVADPSKYLKIVPGREENRSIIDPDFGRIAKTLHGNEGNQEEREQLGVLIFLNCCIENKQLHLSNQLISMELTHLRELLNKEIPGIVGGGD